MLLEYLSLQGLAQLLAKGWFICLLGLYLFRDMELTAAAARNRIVVGAMVCLAALPVLGWIAPVWELPYAPQEREPAATSAITSVNSLVWLYVVISLGMACRLVLQILRIAMISMRSSPPSHEWRETLATVSAPANVRLRISVEITGALTWGAIRPTILVPPQSSTWSPQDRALILRHELAHIERGDWLTVLLARWMCILYWPLPGLRSLFRRLSLSAEQACDDHVLASGGDATDYANVLVRQVRRERLPATLALAQPSELATRVRYLVADIVDRSTLDPQRRWIYPLCVVLVYPLATLTVVSEPPVLRVAPLNRAMATIAPASPESFTSAPITIHKPAPPPTVLSPPPIPNLLEETLREGDKPSIPPPQF